MDIVWFSGSARTSQPHATIQQYYSTMIANQTFLRLGPMIPSSKGCENYTVWRIFAGQIRTQLFLKGTRQSFCSRAPIHDSLGAQMSKRCSMCFLVLRACTDCATTNALRWCKQKMPSLYFWTVIWRTGAESILEIRPVTIGHNMSNTKKSNYASVMLHNCTHGLQQSFIACKPRSTLKQNNPKLDIQLVVLAFGGANRKWGPWFGKVPPRTPIFDLKLV